MVDFPKGFRKIWRDIDKALRGNKGRKKYIRINESLHTTDVHMMLQKKIRFRISDKQVSWGKNCTDREWKIKETISGNVEELFCEKECVSKVENGRLICADIIEHCESFDLNTSGKVVIKESDKIIYIYNGNAAIEGPINLASGYSNFKRMCKYQDPLPSRPCARLTRCQIGIIDVNASNVSISMSAN